MGMHAGWMEPKQGLVVAFAHGPESFTIRFDEPSAANAVLLNTNPWVNFSSEVPQLYDKVN
jgi:hypothetical protein